MQVKQVPSISIIKQFRYINVLVIVLPRIYISICLYCLNSSSPMNTSKPKGNKHGKERVYFMCIMFVYYSKMKKLGSFNPFNEPDQYALTMKIIILKTY